jgi:hypothetical protein
MIPHLEPAYCLDDEVYYSQNVSAVLTVDGETVYVVKNHDDYLKLKRTQIVTYRIAELEQVGELYRCLLAGSDASELLIHLSSDDIMQNMATTEAVMEIQTAQFVC